MEAIRKVKRRAKEAMKEQRITVIFLVLVHALMGYIFSATSIPIMQITQITLYGWIFAIHLDLAVLLFFILMVMSINSYGEFIKAYKNEKASVKALFSGYKVNFLRKIGGWLWRYLWLSIWSIGFIGIFIFAFWLGNLDTGLSILAIPLMVLTVPFFIYIIINRILAYLLIPYILASCPTVKAREAMKLSIRMTEGCKMGIIVMFLSFLGWIVLIALPGLFWGGIIYYTILGGGWIIYGYGGGYGYLITIVLYIIFLRPYMQLTFAGLYIELRDSALAEGTVTAEELGIEEVEAVEEDNKEENSPIFDNAR